MGGWRGARCRYIRYSENMKTNAGIVSVEEAVAYLAANAELRSSLDIEAGAVLSPSPLGRGEHNANFVFCDPSTGTRYVLRVNIAPQPFHTEQVMYEKAALDALEESGCTPRALYADASDTAPGHGVLVISFCEGEELDFDALREGDLRCAVQLMADVHAVKPQADCALYRPDNPARTLFDECMDRFEMYRSSGFEDERITRWARCFIEAAARDLDEGVVRQDKRCIVNTETLPSHFLIPASCAREAAEANENGRFCAAPGYFIDWERPIVGEAAQDLAYFISPTTSFWDSETMLSETEADAIVADYLQASEGSLDTAWIEKRIPAWLALTALRSMTWCCRAHARICSGHDATISPKAKEKLSAYLSDDFCELVARRCGAL